MLGKTSDYLVGLWLQAVTSRAGYASLHDSVPLMDNPTATEVAGASYSRPVITWEASGPRAITNANELYWPNVDATSIAAVGVFTGATSGSFMMLHIYSSVQGLEIVGTRKTFTVPAGELWLQFPA